MTEVNSDLPPGQRLRNDLPRFGLPRFASRLPRRTSSSKLRISGAVASPAELALSDLEHLPRMEQVSDFHCVTTWSVRGLRWSGYAFHDFLEWLSPRVQPGESVSWVAFFGADGHVASLPLDFAVRPDVLLADRLDGRPLSMAHGAPLRIVAPAHYGYKSVKHLTEIRLTDERVPGSAGRKEHPTGLAEAEQRVELMPGWLFRRLIRPAAAPLVWYFRRHTPKDPESAA